MDAYEFFTKKHEKDIDYSNIYTLGRIYNLLGKYFPSAIRYLNRIMEKYPNDEYNLLFREVTIKKKKYVNDKIKSIFELIYQRASTTKNDGIVKMVNDSIWILKRVNAENSRDKQWKEDMIKKLETVYDTDKWDIGMIRR